MKKKGINRVSAKYAKSSAALITLILHGIFILVAVTFVAFQVITKEEKKFEAKVVKRKAMKLRKLQVPVNIQKKRKLQPKLRKRIVVKAPRHNVTPQISLPEITGVAGGVGNVGGGGGLGTTTAGIGFAMPKIKLFGTRVEGEKIFIIMDGTGGMMTDEMGGVAAYNLIKTELFDVLDKLGPATLFNMAVFSGGTHLRFPKMVPANEENVEKVKEWIKPLNTTYEMGNDKSLGWRSLGPGGIEIEDDMVVKPLRYDRAWARASLVAMKQQADAVFLLTAAYNVNHRHPFSSPRQNGWTTQWQAEWEEVQEKVKVKLLEENLDRKKRGFTPRVFKSLWHATRHYFPHVDPPPGPPGGWGQQWYFYTPRDFKVAFETTRKRWAPVQMKSGLSKSKRNYWSFNVIFFYPPFGDEWHKNNSEERFDELTSYLGGSFKTIAGYPSLESAIFDWKDKGGEDWSVTVNTNVMRVDSPPEPKYWEEDPALKQTEFKITENVKKIKPDADTYIHGLYLEVSENFGDEPVIELCSREYRLQTTSLTRKGYMKFDLLDLDSESFDKAMLKLQVKDNFDTKTDQPAEFDIRVFGINNDVEGKDFLEEDLCWQDAPANDKNDNGMNSDDDEDFDGVKSELTTRLGTIRIPAERKCVVTLSTPALAEYLKECADFDGIASLIFIRKHESATLDTFIHSKDSSYSKVPILYLQ